MSEMEGVLVQYLGGLCPVQSEGTIDGKPFYFRSRGSRWCMNIGPDLEGVILEPEWQYCEDYGAWPEAGYISDDEAKSFIAKAVALYRAPLPTKKDE